MASHTGGWYVIDTLYRLGVRDIFSLSGGHINPIYDAVVESDIRLIDMHHEQGAAMAADAYGRLKRQPGVCLVTAGPGFTNTLTGVAGAYLSNASLLLLSGKSGIEENDRLSLQDIDQESMARPVTKWARTVYEVGRLADYVSKAYMRAATGRPGPVYLGMPYEVLYASCAEEEMEPCSYGLPMDKPLPPEDALERAARLLREARRPVLVAGSGAWYAGAGPALERLLEISPMPLFTLNFGRGVVPDDHPFCFGPASPSAPVAFKRITSEADLIVLIGVRLTIYMGWGRTFNPDAKVIQVDIDPSEIGRNRPVELGVVADAAAFADHLAERLAEDAERPRRDVWLAKCREWRDEEWAEVARIRRSRRRPIHPVRVVKAVEDVLPRDGVVVVDGGETQVWTDTTYRVLKPGGYVKGGPLGCMGVGVPFAVGAKAALPDAPVLLLSGDGAIGMNLMEFETALRHDLPFVAVVCNDGAWGMTKHQLELSYGKDRPRVGLDLPPIAYHEVVRALGGYGEAVDDPRQLSAAIGRALDSGKPALVNVSTDPTAISPSTYVLTQMMMPKER